MALRQRTEGGERLDNCGQVGVGAKTLEVRVVVEDRRTVVLGDRGSEVIQRRNAQVLMRGAELVLQIGGSAFRTFGDPQKWKFARVDRRKDTTGPRLEHERGARRDEASRDPVGHLAVSCLIELWAAQAPERARIEQQQASAHGCRLACRMRWTSSRSGAGPVRSRSANVSRARAWARSCASSSRSFASAPRRTSSASVGASAPSRSRRGSSAAASTGVSVIECRGCDVGTSTSVAPCSTL